MCIEFYWCCSTTPWNFLSFYTSPGIEFKFLNMVTHYSSFQQEVQSVSLPYKSCLDLWFVSIHRKFCGNVLQLLSKASKQGFKTLCGFCSVYLGTLRLLCCEESPCSLLEDKSLHEEAQSSQLSSVSQLTHQLIWLYDWVQEIPVGTVVHWIHRIMRSEITFVLLFWSDLLYILRHTWLYNLNSSSLISILSNNFFASPNHQSKW